MAGKHGTPRERFTTKYQIHPQTKCWEWTSYVDHKGYGMFWLARGMVRSHRAAYIIFKGELGVSVHSVKKVRYGATWKHVR